MNSDQSNQLAKIAQNQVPFAKQPFHEFAKELRVNPEEVLSQLKQWKAEGLLREISAVLEGSALGYDSALVAGEIPEERVEEVAAVVNRHPTVTHNYLRNHRYNLWFTIAVPFEMGLEKSLALLAQEAGVEQFYPLRRTHTFKIGVNFDLKNRVNQTAQLPLNAVDPVKVTDEEKRILRSLQTPLSFAERPFRELAIDAGVDEGELLSFASKHFGGAIRKYVATFHHRKLGVRGNGMAVYQVPEEDLAEKGHQLAACPEISHCYARNPIDGFPYRLYSMLHGPDNESCSKLAEELAERIGAEDYIVLFSSKEFKKCRLRYFLPELDAWWEERADS